MLVQGSAGTTQLRLTLCGDKDTHIDIDIDEADSRGELEPLTHRQARQGSTTLLGDEESDQGSPFKIQKSNGGIQSKRQIPNSQIQNCQFPKIPKSPTAHDECVVSYLHE